MTVHRERIVVDGELLVRRTIRMPPELKAVFLRVFLVVVRVLILCQEEVIVVTARWKVEELTRNVVEYLIFLSELL